MLNKPDDATTIALARIGKGAEWEQIEKWLLTSREALVQQSLNDDQAKSRKAQGAFQAIDEFIRQTRAAVESSTRR